MTAQSCPACGAGNPESAKFCNQCATPLSGGALHDERRMVTVAFSDVSGYTTMSERLDPEDLREVMGTIFDRAHEVITAHGGRIDKVIGDAVLAVYGDQVTREDDAEQAVRATLAFHAEVEDLSPSLELRTSMPLGLHSGVNTGVVVTGDLDHDRASGPLGDTVNVASRLEAMAATGEILLGPETVRLVADAFELEDRGLQKLEGKEEKVPVARVLGPVTRETVLGRRRSAFVGRARELETLLAAVDRLEQGEGSVITVCADAGLGKTRLFEEFRHRLGSRVQWLEGRAYAYGRNIPYLPVVDLLSRAASVDESDSAPVARAKVEAAVAAVVGEADAPDLVHPLTHLFGFEDNDVDIDREAFQARLLDSLRQIIEAMAKTRPTVVCLQDLHWVDPSTATLLRRLIGSLGIPLLVICNNRPGFSLGGNGTRPLQLDELTSDDTALLVRSLLDGEEPPAGLVELVISRTDGNPFFVEEIVNSLLEAGVVIRRTDGWTTARSLGEVEVPSTIRGVIGSRIDNLDDSRRRVLREASVVGREFLYEILHRVSEETRDVEDSLDDLVGYDLIRTKAIDPDLEYVFKHALTQEVAYDGLLRSERQLLHLRVAEAMEAQLGDRLGEFTETLAYHYSRSGRPEEAARYLRAAGRKAVDRYAIDEADQHFQAAYDLLTAADPTPARERLLLEVLIDWGFVRYYQADYIAIRQQWERHADLPDRVGDPGLRARWLGWQGHVQFMHLVDLVESRHTLDAAVEVGRGAGDMTAVAHGLAWQSWTAWVTGRTEDAAAVLPEVEHLAAELTDEMDARYARLKTLGGAGSAAASSGDFLLAHDCVQRLLVIAEQSGSVRAWALAQSVLAQIEFLLGEFEAAIHHATQQAASEADPVYAQVGHLWRAFLLATSGRYEEAREDVDRSRPFVDEADLRLWVRGYDAVEGLIDLGSGRPSRGMNRLQRARQASVDSEYRWMVTVIDLCIATALARVATGEERTGAATVLRNPAFVMRHGRVAARQGREELGGLIERLPGEGFGGFVPIAMYELAKLDLHEGRVDDARSLLERVEELLEAAGDCALRREALQIRSGLVRDERV